ncbi:TetR/AcrR family transcriptional regulator [Sporosarcina limicola]|uniref:AcrR family transcriptional regulator n=1 Tax=Sporosarcina limicola TaxID=34101 RepID=A0A927MQ73_9BACL|nr:TetR/AcrR family transcriptional regulator [Sporosarcina limicola]MBE1555356.1 AcrR family transcriptional regulator [Sporosarcina limicola]
MTTQPTPDRILDAALKLISEKGYTAATTKAIAELAGVNEVTIFRHFGNKRGVLKAIVATFSYSPLLKEMLQKDVTWELETDLFHFSMEYFRYMMSIKDFVMISFKEAIQFPEIDEEIANVPLIIKRELMEYFSKMKDRGKLADTNIEATAMAFIALNFGFFISRARLGSSVSQLSIEDLLQTSTSIFSRGITP